jgi:hypothetical protein
VYEFLRNWQTGLGALAGSFLGFLALLGAALYNFKLTRRRDTELRRDEILSVETALYGEIIHLRKDAAGLALAVAHHEKRGQEFDEQFVQDYQLRDPILYPALASKIGMLPAEVALSITKFYGNYELASRSLPELVKGERAFTYAPTGVLRPAVSAVFDIEPVLRRIEELARLPEAERPKIGLAVDIVEHYDFLAEEAAKK